MLPRLASETIRLLKKVAYARVCDSRQLYQWQEISILKKLFNKFNIDCVFDLGANRGQYARLLRKKVRFQGSILSIEPNPTAFKILEQNASFDRNWHVRNVAIGEENSPKIFSVMVGEQFSTLSKPISTEAPILTSLNSIARQITVEVETLDTLFEQTKRYIQFERPFLKMDTQGYDTVIVRAGRKIVNRFAGIQSELSFKRLYADSVGFEETLRLYEELGFSLCAIVPNNQGHFPHLIEQDGIFLNTSFLDKV